MTETEFSPEQVAIITGACSGIGAAVAKQLAEKGLGHITITGLTSDGLEKTKESMLSANPTVEVHVLEGDLTTEGFCEQLVKETVDKFGRLDVLISNAGWSKPGPLFMQTMGNFEKIFDVNVKPAVKLTKLCLNYLRERKGSIVITSSILGIQPCANTTFYCMSKAALDMFTRCMAAEEGQNGVRINNVNPGLTDSGFTEKSLGAVRAAKLIEGAKTLPVGRAAEPYEIANVITFLAGKRSSFMTGSCVVVDGGFTCLTPPT
ncbi:dihydroanticapsin 7-dehydrogenase-like [Convolutriloba macropyga]|uniref:dihydroanticapsin 7-dehydrogenase-like n=1 Tax=Convolutriloba macropyga TaxID=536237 RepID=UPI003F51BAC9